MKRKAAWLGALLLATSASARGAPASIEEALPSDTVLYARVALGPEVRKTGLWRLWNDSGFAPARERLSRGRSAALLAHLEEGEGEAVFVLLRPFVDAVRSGAGIPAEGLALLVFDDTPGNRRLAALAGSLSGGEKSVRQESGFRIESPRAGSFFATARGRGRVVAGAEPDILSFIRSLEAPPARSLASEPAFRAARAAAGRPEGGFLYLDCRPLLEKLGSSDARALAAFLKVEALAVGTAPDGPGVRSALYLHAPESPLLAAARGAADDGLLKYAPDGSLACGAFSLDAREAARLAAGACLALGDDGREKLRKAQAVRAFLDALLSVPTTDWLDAVGPQAGFYVTNSFPPSGCVILRKGETFDRVEPIILAFLRAAEAMGGDTGRERAASFRRIDLKETAHRGRLLRYDAASPLQVGYATDGRWVLVGPAAEVRSALTRADAASGDLRGAEAFRSARAGSFPGAHAFLWADLPALAPFLPLLAASGRPEGMRAFLADPALFAPVLAPHAVEAAATPDGWVFRERGGVPLLAGALAAAARERVRVEGAVLDGAPGVPVTAVEPGSLAERVGIRAGDRILSYGGTAVTLATVSETVSKTPPGTEVEVVVSRGAERLAFRVPGGGRLGVAVSVGIGAGTEPAGDGR